jgi:TonB family protein
MPVSVAQEETREFNDAWFAYTAARDSGSKTEIRDTAKAVLDIARESLPSDDERLPLLMRNYGTALVDSGDVEAARDVLEQAVDLSKSIHGKRSVEVVPVLTAYADSLAEIRNGGAQDRYYREAMKIVAENSGKDSTEYADIALRAGIRIYEMSRTTSGKRYLEDAYEIYASELGPSSKEAGLAAYYLAKAEYSQRDFKGSTEYGLLALDGLQQNPEYLRFARALLVQGYERRGMSEEATEHCLAIGRDSMITPNQDFLPLFRLPPKYPPNMFSAGIEGYVDIEFTVDEQGFVRDPEVTDREGGKSFEKEALAAVLRFRYAPKFVEGVAVATEGVKTRITFKIGR